MPDLYGNPLSEEADYRLHVIRAIPSLHVFDRHVVTDEERILASKLNKKSSKASLSRKVACGAPPVSISSTVRLLMKEVKVGNPKMVCRVGCSQMDQ